MSILQKISTPEAIFQISREELMFFESIGVGKVREDEPVIEIYLSKSDKIRIIDHLTIGAGGSNAIEKLSYDRH